MKFDPHASYRRTEIAGAFGGFGPGPLPAKQGDIVCGLFDLVAAETHMDGRVDLYVSRMPKGLDGLDRPIPVFLKVSTQFWRYAGEYTLTSVDTSTEATEPSGGSAVAVLKFKPTRPALKLVKGRK